MDDYFKGFLIASGIFLGGIFAFAGILYLIFAPLGLV